MLANLTVFGQVTTGNLQGVVRDPNNAVVAGAQVRITNAATGIARETTTNEDGYYRVTNLLPGDNYTVEVTAAGFAAAKLERVAVRLAAENSADVQVGLQGVGATVEVSGGEGDIIQTTQNQLRTDFEPRQVTQLPLVGGSIDNLALLVPGVTTPGDTDFTNGVGITANGNRGRSNNFQIDGQDNNDNQVAGPTLTLTNQEAIGEFQVITNNFSAEFGRNSGAQINSITKAGTNDFRGSLFYFHQNSALNAQNNVEERDSKSLRFLANNGFPQFEGIAGRSKDPFRNNRFGAALGGPIIKNRAFFFATYQGDYTRGEATFSGLATGQITFTPESAQLARQLFPNAATAQLVSTNVGGGPAFVQNQGQFFIAPPVADTNGDGVADTFVYGPGNPYGITPTANRLAPSLFVCTINPGLNAQGQSNPCPAANLRTLFSGEGVRVVPTRTGSDEFITREDINFTDKDVLSVRYIYNDSRFPIASGRFVAGALFDVPSLNHNIGATYTRTLSPNLVNEARFNFSYLDVKFGDPSATRPEPQIGFSGQRDLAGNFNSLTFGAQNTFPQSRVVKVFQEQDTLSTTIGNHAVKFGIDLRQQRVNSFFLPDFLGRYTFRGGSNSGTLPVGAFFDETGAARTGQALAFENLLLNRPRDINFAVGEPSRNFSQDDYFFFVQDDWRVRPNLTLNLGLRYELSTQPFNPLIEELLQRESDPSTALFSTAFPIETRTIQKLPVDKNNFGPRVGFAYSPNLNFLGDRFTNGRTVVRGGVGVSYDPSFFNIVNNTVTAAPFVGTGTIRQNNPGATGQTLGVPFLPNTLADLSRTPGTNDGDPRLFNQTLIAQDFHNPYSISYNFGIQQELFKNGVLEVRYVGTLIRDQFQTVNGNPNISLLNNSAQCLGLAPGTFTSGNVVGSAAANTAAACGGAGFQNRPGTNGNGRIDPNFGAARLRTNGANGRYDGLQTEFRTRFSDLTLYANYTFSKTTDNASEIFSSLGGGQTIAVPQHPFDTDAGERGLSAFHQKHNFTSNFVYSLPFYKNQRGFLGKLLGGYQVSGIVRVGSGRPYTPITFFGTYDAGFEAAFSGAIGLLRPYNGNSDASNGTIAFSGNAAGYLLGDERAFGTNQFIVYNTNQPGSSGTIVPNIQAAQQQARLIYNDTGLVALGIPLDEATAFQYFRTPYGIGRNTFFGDSFSLVNAAVLKTTRISERMSLEFRAEVANLLNHRNFGVPDPITEDAFTVFTPTTGVVGTYQNPGFNNGGSRTLRLGFRFIF